MTGFPLELENLEKLESIFQLGNFEQTGKVKEFQTNVIYYFLSDI